MISPQNAKRVQIFALRQKLYIFSEKAKAKDNHIAYMNTQTSMESYTKTLTHNKRKNENVDG